MGVILDNCLSLDAHISNICRSTHFHLRNIGRIRTLLTFHATAQLIHALITTRLDFCNSILYNLPNNKIERLQRIQNQAARILTRSPRRNHIIPVLRELHWLRISDRIIFKILILTHKAFHGVAPVFAHAGPKIVFFWLFPLLVRHVQPVFLSDYFYMLLQLYGINSYRHQNA